DEPDGVPTHQKQ
nr:RecName: Full=Pseudohemocyanin [Liocarcinus depurator]P84768.1 RecName: Full=Pseudohemocyanin [Liocarcinus holsatus]